MPERCFDVGIAEGHAVTFSAGLAATGLIPFCNIYSSFMQRAYDNAIHDVAIQKLNVVMCLDRAGLVGEDGATHHGAFDVAYFRPIPNIIVSSPMNESELRNLMYTASLGKGPFVIRYPRGHGVTADWHTPMEEITIGRSRLLREGENIAVLSFGPVGNYVTEALDEAGKNYGISATHVDMRFVKPLDEETLHSIGKKFRKIITVEDGVIKGGMGSAVLEFMNSHGYDCHIEMLGIPDSFVEHGTPDQLHALCGYDTKGILEAVKKLSDIKEEK